MRATGTRDTCIRQRTDTRAIKRRRSVSATATWRPATIILISQCRWRRRFWPRRRAPRPFRCHAGRWCRHRSAVRCRHLRLRPRQHRLPRRRPCPPVPETVWTTWPTIQATITTTTITTTTTTTVPTSAVRNRRYFTTASTATTERCDRRSWRPPPPL